MFLSHLKIQNLRSFSRIEILPSDGINFITGDNGAGKTTILEAIYLIARNRSFRTSQLSNLINHKSKNASIDARFESTFGPALNIHLTKSNSSHFITLNGSRQKQLSKIALSIPLSIVTPNIHELIDNGPTYRRKFIDWAVFHVEHEYKNLISTYQKLLEQRNYCLKNELKMVDIWNEQIADISVKITNLRNYHISEIANYFQNLVNVFFKQYDFKLYFFRGWKDDISLLENFHINLKKDISRGYTSVGPHRADFKIILNGKNIKEILSTGEVKLISILLKIAHLQNISTINNESPLFLCDDLLSDLDSKTTDLLIELICDLHYQTFITTQNNHRKMLEVNVFHVEHGQII